MARNHVAAALAALDEERLDDAILACERAMAAGASPALVLYVLGLVAIEVDTPMRALKLLEQAHTRDDTAQEFAEALAALHARVGHVNEGLYYAKLATVLSPHPDLAGMPKGRLGGFFNNLERGRDDLYGAKARRHLEAGNFAEAAAAAATQLELTPGDPPTLRLLAEAATAAGDLDRALSARQAVQHGAAASPDDQSRLAQTLARAGRFGEAKAAHDVAYGAAPDDPVIGARRLADLARDPDGEPSAMTREAVAWRTRHAAPVVARPRQGEIDHTADRALKVGYMFGAAFGSDTSALLEILLEAHQRRGEPTCCYVDGRRSDVTAERLVRLAGRWTDLAGIDDETACHILRGDRLDAVVDLAGFGPGGRPLVLARRPAPIALALLGAAAGEELPALDAVAIDSAHAAAGLRDGLRVLCAPRELVAWQPPSLVPDPAPLADRAPRFGVVGDLALLTPRLAAAAAAPLRAIPESRLLIVNAAGLDSATASRPLEYFANLGCRDRVDLIHPAENDFATGFEIYAHIDVALLPWGGSDHVEACRALWMGVPAIALVRPDALSRVRSALSAAGRADWVCEDESRFAEKAIALANDLDLRASLRGGLRDELRRSRLLDTAGFARALGDAIRVRWREFTAEERRDAVA